MIPSAVVCSASESTLTDILPALHAAGMGATARVIRPGRMSMVDQLRRIGVKADTAPERIEHQDQLIVVLAAGRSRSVADLVHQRGASATWIVGINGDWHLHDDGPLETRIRTTDVVAEVQADQMAPDLRS